MEIRIFLIQWAKFVWSIRLSSSPQDLNFIRCPQEDFAVVGRHWEVVVVVAAVAADAAAPEVREGDVRGDFQFDPPLIRHQPWRRCTAPAASGTWAAAPAGPSWAASARAGSSATGTTGASC